MEGVTIYFFSNPRSSIKCSHTTFLSTSFYISDNLICIFSDNLSCSLVSNLLSFLPKWNILNTERFLVIRDTSVRVTLAWDDTLQIIAHIQAAQHRGYWCSSNIWGGGRLSPSGYHFVKHSG